LGAQHQLLLLLGEKLGFNIALPLCCRPRVLLLLLLLIATELVCEISCRVAYLWCIAFWHRCCCCGSNC
jgi:hypothetical protein